LRVEQASDFVDIITASHTGDDALELLLVQVFVPLQEFAELVGAAHTEAKEATAQLQLLVRVIRHPWLLPPENHHGVDGPGRVFHRAAEWRCG